jgi:septum formation protein
MPATDLPGKSALWLPVQPLVLASGSAIRAQMLRHAGIPVEICPAAINERAVESPLLAQGQGPAEIALALARAKARQISCGHPARWVLGADQVLVVDGEFFHKPANEGAARTQLGRLSGRTHHLVSGAILMRDGICVSTVSDEASMTMRHLDNSMLDRYLAAAGDAALSSVGCYQVEGLGVHLFERIVGSHFTILGLPLLPLLAALRQAGVVAA